MGKFDGILICTDFDGTLAEHAHVSPENAAAIRYFKENGGLFTISSGRHPVFAVEHLDGITVNAPVTGYNGALIYDAEKKEYLFRGGREKEKFLPIIKRVMAEESSLYRVTIHEAERGRDYSFNIHEPGFSLEDCIENAQDPIYNMLFITTGGGARALRAKCEKWMPEEFSVRCSWPDGMELINRGEEKGDAMKKLKEITGARLLIGAGNDENDVTLLTMADVGYAVADAEESVLAVADRVTLPCHEHALAAIIKDIEETLI